MILLLPVYQPDTRLLDLAGEVHARQVVVVDDGSDDTSVCDRAAALGCTVLRHDRNQGKGVALRTGFRHVLETCPGEDVVCADADGQHHAGDIEAVATRVRETGRMVLGVRHDVRKMPLRSRFGNTLTEVLFRAATGRSVRDTQTGLRGVPGDLLGDLITVPGDRFDYEMNMLLRAAEAGWPIEEVEIPTRYLDDNSSSHFAPLADAVRIYGPLLRFAALRSVR